MALEVLDQAQCSIGNAIEDTVRWAVPVIERLLPDVDAKYLISCLEDANIEMMSLRRALEKINPARTGG